eukprot:CAMPEP_0119040546 /NCGR_PEP_ID=MMETSP1177-20130426/10515_1 /TAXON_ID=2985 /ORGANISM="Ochromonas sp, Strain CCMP1899" /LENGTH=390 /DNA_ID=CAMNT_0007005709 /DNA_START=126 /DNA_END=1299 /DNA_ORIENTATION=+
MAVSKTIEMHSLTKDMEKAGQKVFSLCVGEPDYQPPLEVLRATREAADNGLTKYTAVTGDIELRQAICNDLLKRKNVSYKPEEIVVANGAKQSVIQALLSIVSPGDGVLIAAPYWPSYPDMVKICGGIPIVINSKPENNYIFSAPEQGPFYKKNLNIKVLIFCNPCNPTGTVTNKENLLEMVEVLKEFNVITISDEIYERLTYDEEHVSLASLPGMMERTVTINGFSKSHSMTGYRIGYSASPIGVAKAISKLQSQITSCASSIGQQAALSALNEVSDSWMEDRIEELKEKRDLALSLIRSIPHVDCPTPQGAFYVMPEVKAYFGKKTASGHSVDNAHELCLELLRDQQVALVSGDAFGAPNCVRISYAASKELISESINRLKLFLESLV